MHVMYWDIIYQEKKKRTMANIKGCFLSQSKHWATPKKLYEDLDKEFHFDFDPCPYQHEPAPLFGNSDGLSEPWGSRTFCNPPYGREIGFWVKKAYDESQKGKLIVLLIPSRTDTKWWHRYIMKADEIRFLEGRLHFNDAPCGAPFPSCVVIFRPSWVCPECRAIDEPKKEIAQIGELCVLIEKVWEKYWHLQEQYRKLTGRQHEWLK